MTVFWISLAIIILFYIIRLLWRAYTSPAHTLGRQAANMGWGIVGRINTKEGYRDVCYGRDGVEARVSYATGEVFLIKPIHPEPFKDFIELERWLAQRQKPLLQDTALSDISREVNDLLNVLNEAQRKYQSEAFKEIGELIRKSILAHPDEAVRLFQEHPEFTASEWVYSQIGNIAGDMLESGNHHIYRGVLNPIGLGPDLLKIFDASYDELLAMKAKDIDIEYANEQKSAIRQNIKRVG